MQVQCSEQKLIKLQAKLDRINRRVRYPGHADWSENKTGMLRLQAKQVERKMEEEYMKICNYKYGQKQIPLLTCQVYSLHDRIDQIRKNDSPERNDDKLTEKLTREMKIAESQLERLDAPYKPKRVSKLKVVPPGFETMRKGAEWGDV